MYNLHLNMLKKYIFALKFYIKFEGNIAKLTDMLIKIIEI